MTRKSFFTILLALGACFAAVRLYADDERFLPDAHELFKPLQADPRELQYSVRAAFPVNNRPLGEAAMGDYLGIYRWTLPWEKSACQLSFGGGMFARFDISEQSNSLQVVDFYANVPFDFQFNKWSIRFMPYHTSSHLGDDYVARTGVPTVKHAWDNLRWVVSWDAYKHLRLYSGYTYVFRTLPHGLNRNAVQAGFETTSRYWSKGCARLYWANDFQSWGRVDWNPMFTSQVGVRFTKSENAVRAVSLISEFMAGSMPHGQFYDKQETRWNFGVKFDLT